MMCHPAPDAANGFNNKVIEEFRANDGRVTGSLTGTPILLLHHVGARSGIERVTPLAYTPYRAGGYLDRRVERRIANASELVPQPEGPSDDARRDGPGDVHRRAEELQGTARAELWPKLLAASPSLREFDATTTRRVPLFGQFETNESGSRAMRRPTSMAANAATITHRPRRSPRHHAKPPRAIPTGPKNSGRRNTAQPAATTPQIAAA